MAPLNPGQAVRVGLIGFGYASKTFHAPLLSATGDFRIEVISSRHPAEVAAAVPGAAVWADPLAVATHGEVDLIVIASPNDTHAPLAEAALRAGKQVVVDKPFTLTLPEARHLATLAAETGGLLSVFQNRRWDSDFLTVQRVIQAGALGQVALFESRLDRFRPQVRDRWRERAVPGSGLLYDLGPHLIDQALVLFGVPESVQATLAQQRPQAQSVDYAHLVLRYGPRVVALQASMLVSGGTARFLVHGERASLVKQRPDVQEAQLRAGMIPGANGWGVDPDDAILYEGASGRTEAVKAAAGDQRGYYAALREALYGRGPNPVLPTQAVTVMAILEAALRSHEEGRRIAPDLTEAERAAWA
jgi:predicted dehydrogenase